MFGYGWTALVSSAGGLAATARTSGALLALSSCAPSTDRVSLAPLHHSLACAAELSAPLRTELVLALHRDALQAVPLLLGAHDPLQLADVVARLQLQTFAPGEHQVKGAGAATRQASGCN
jgi:hypothetical protein